MTFDKSDEETLPDQQKYKDKDNDKDKYNDKDIQKRPSKSDPRDLRPFRHLIRLMRHDMTKTDNDNE